jgi:RNA polymerase sigma-70 factor (ECF subfamily)
MDAIDTFAILAREHEKMLFAYVLGLVRDPVLAQDIVQEAFLKAFEKLSSLRETESFPAWIRTIARHAACDQRAANAREIPTDPEVVRGMEDMFVAFDRPETGDSWDDRLHEVKRCFERLPEPLREVCRLHYFEDKKARTIAQRLGINAATVWKRLERARDGLRKCVERRLGLAPGGGTDG